jgi:hypothetical protein
VSHRLDELGVLTAAARKSGDGLRRRMRRRLERARLQALQRRLRASSDDATHVPGLARLRRLAEEFHRAGLRT